MMANISTPARLACADIYDPIKPDSFTKVYRVGNTVCGTVTINGMFYIAMQGTENFAGWLADCDIDPVRHASLGLLHGGFYNDLPALIKMLCSDIPTNVPTVITGHSKGAGEAIILAALLKLLEVESSFQLFACPNAGDATFAAWVGSNLSGTSYRNVPKFMPFFGDPVPLVPIHPYVSPVPHTSINRPPFGLKYFFDVEWHCADLYRSAFP